MGDKYIIELEEKPFHDDNGDFLYRVKGFNSLVFDMTGIGKLTPYTEPDLEQVKKKAYAEGFKDGQYAKRNGLVANYAYEKGYKTAKIQCGIQAEKDMREVGKMHYQRGLYDAWDAARTLWNTPNRKEIFGNTTFNTVLTTLTAQEAIEKIRQYEQEKDRQARIEFNGEEIKDVLNTTMKECNVSLDEIASVLEKMRGEQDG